MADFTYDPGLVFNDVTMEPARLATGILCNANDLTTPLQVFDLNNSPLPTLQTNEQGYVGRFRANVPDGVMVFPGGTVQPVSSIEQQRAGLSAQSDASGASALATEALTGWPGDIDGLRRQAMKVYAKAHAPVPAPTKRPVPKPSRSARPGLRSRKLVVDGKLGKATVKAVQRAIKATADGSWGRTSKRALQRHLRAKGYRLKADGVIGPSTVRALQRYLKITADGTWGPKTTAAIQRRLNARTF